MYRVARLVFMVLGLCSADFLAAGEEKPEPALPRLHPGDEGFLLQMRKQLHAGHPPQWLEDAQPEQQLEWFKHGLRQAAAEQPPRPPVPHAPQVQAPPPAWRSLLEAAMQLEHVAHALDQQQLWEQAKQVRKTAAELRQQARQRNSDRFRRQGFEGSNPRNRNN